MGGNERSIPETFTQVNFNIKEELLYKVKYIVLNDERYKNNSEVYKESIADFIRKWEAENGKIKVPKK